MSPKGLESPSSGFQTCSKRSYYLISRPSASQATRSTRENRRGAPLTQPVRCRTPNSSDICGVLTRSDKGLFHLGSLSKCKHHCPGSHLNSTSPCASGPDCQRPLASVKSTETTRLARFTEETLKKEPPQKTIHPTCVSLKKPSGKSGRIARSIRRLQRSSRLPGAPSLRKYPPGILPWA